MRKFGIPVNGRMTEVFELPPDVENVAKFLAVQFPTLTGFVEVPEECFNGNPLKEGNIPMSKAEITTELAVAKQAQDALAPLEDPK